MIIVLLASRIASHMSLLLYVELFILIFSRFFILILLFSTCCSVRVLSYCTTLLYVMAVVSAVAGFLTLGTYVFIVHTVFLYFLT